MEVLDETRTIKQQTAAVVLQTRSTSVLIWFFHVYFSFLGALLVVLLLSWSTNYMIYDILICCCFPVESRTRSRVWLKSKLLHFEVLIEVFFNVFVSGETSYCESQQDSRAAQPDLRPVLDIFISCDFQLTENNIWDVLVLISWSSISKLTNTPNNWK